MAYFRNKLKSELNTATNIPAPVDIPPEITDEDSLQRETVAPAEPPQQTAKPVPLEGDEGTALLRQHIASAKRAEEIQQQRQAMAAAENRRMEWVKASPLAQANYAALGPLHQEAMHLGLDDLSPEYFHHLESGLAAIAESQEQRQEQPVETAEIPEPEMAEPSDHVVQETPEFFRPKRTAAPAPTAALVSAPVSRTIPNAGDRDRLPSDPASIRLTPQQREAAKIAGISETEYARGMVAIEREKREGRRQP